MSGGKVYGKLGECLLGEDLVPVSGTEVGSSGGVSVGNVDGNFEGVSVDIHCCM